ncbi:MAG: amidase [Pseudomonadota bacterium]
MTDATRVSDDIAARLARIEAEDGVLRSFIRVDAEAARSAAAVADGRRARGMTSGPLDGVATAVKDNLAVAGAPWTGGLGGWRARVATEDAAVVARLKSAGAIVLGGLNMEEGALGAVTDNAAFGRCLNPLGPLGEGALTPGGSSGGSAAAVAAGFVDLSLGTDTMGSVRIPAAYCGLFGLKPTHGLIPRSGMACLAPSLDTIGPLARDPALLWPAVLAMAGLDSGDPEARPAPKGWDVRPEASLRGLVLGVPTSLEEMEIEAEVLAGFERAQAAARAAGAQIIEVATPGWEPSRARRGGLLVSEAEGAVEMAELLASDDPEAATEGFRALLDYGARASSARLVDAYGRVRAAAGAAHRALGECHAALLPTAPQRAFRHGAPIPANQADLTAWANFAGLPAVALPVPSKGGPAEGGPSEGLPASVQLMGPAFSEARLTAWAEALAEAASA